MAENIPLRHLISETTDQLVSELYTDDKVQARVKAWQKNVIEPSQAEQLAYLMAESRDFSEELVYRVISQLLEKGYLHAPDETQNK